MGAAVSLTAQPNAAPVPTEDERAAALRVLKSKLQHKSDGSAAPQAAPPPPQLVAPIPRADQIEPIPPAVVRQMQTFQPGNQLPGLPTDRFTPNAGVKTSPSGLVHPDPPPPAAPPAHVQGQPTVAVPAAQPNTTPDPVDIINKRFPALADWFKPMPRPGPPPPPPAAPAEQTLDRGVPPPLPASPGPLNQVPAIAPVESAGPRPPAVNDPARAAAVAPVAEPQQDPRAEQAALVKRLQTQGWQIVKPPLHRVQVGTETVTQRLRNGTTREITRPKYEMQPIDNNEVIRMRGMTPGHALPVNIFIPPNLKNDPAHAKLDIHLPGWVTDKEGNAEVGVFAKTDFAALLARSKSSAPLVVPESEPYDATFEAEWFGRQGAKNFDAFATNLTHTLGYDKVTDVGLTTHSGTGSDGIGDHIVLNTELGQAVLRRGHFDDGQGAAVLAQRYRADEAVLKRGGRVFAVANAGGVSARMIDKVAAAHINRVDPIFRNRKGEIDFDPARGLSRREKPASAAPRAAYEAVESAPVARLTELNIVWGKDTRTVVGNEQGAHFRILNLLYKALGD